MNGDLKNELILTVGSLSVFTSLTFGVRKEKDLRISGSQMYF